MADEPFIANEDRPELSLDMDGKVGDLTVRELATILGFEPAVDVIKEGKSETKEHKDSKDNKDSKDHQEQKQQKDAKDQKDSKDHKDQKDQKDTKDQKEQKDTKDHKERKDNKDVIFEPKNRIKDATEGKRFTPERVLEIDLELAKHSSELDEVVKRISGLEQVIEELKDRKK